MNLRLFADDILKNFTISRQVDFRSWVSTNREPDRQAGEKKSAVFFAADIGVSLGGITFFAAYASLCGINLRLI